jgi:peptidoglycan/xylan/chitin deacetylase (PgdA/CDA1 family)
MRGRAGKGFVTIAFDDAYLDTYKHAVKYLDKLNIKSTIAVPADFLGKRFEKRPVIGPGELRGLVRSGHEIASHTLTHPNLRRLGRKNKSGMASEISGSKRKLEALTSGRIDSFVLPYIKQNQSPGFRLMVKRHYKSLRTTRDTPVFNRIPVKDPYKLAGFAVMKKHSLLFLNKQVDNAEKNRRWLIEVFHLVSKRNTQSAHRPKPYRFFMHIDDFKKHIGYILSKNVQILTEREAVKRCDTTVSPPPL